MAIITISQQLGSLGTDIANVLKEELHFKYLDKESLEEKLVSKYGLPEEKIERYDEKKPAFWDMFSSDKDQYLHFLKTAIYEFARKDSCIIIGRGGQILFQEVPGVLRVRIVAPTELRVERIKECHKYDDRLAEQLIRHSDHDRAGFHRFFFHVNWEDYHLYDLMINTQTFTVPIAVQLIRDALQSFGAEEKQQETENKMNDLCLAQEVVTSIAYENRVPIHFLEAISVRGVVTLRGSAMTTEDVSRSESITRNVPGVKNVINEIYCIPHTYGMT
jgi:cytidylate kinase